MTDSRDDVALSGRDFLISAIQACASAIPVAGPVSQYISSALTERRLKRLEQTLAEVAAELHSRGTTGVFDTEEFATLFETIAPALSRANQDAKRQRFRALLINAAQLNAGDERWNDATLAADILEGIEPPGLAILAAMTRSHSVESRIRTRPSPAVFEIDQDPESPTATGYAIPYDPVIVQEWLTRLREKRLIFWRQDPGNGYDGVFLTDLGKLFVLWVSA
jgi:hypothetical protein